MKMYYTETPDYRESLMLECSKELAYRTGEGAGSWRNGLPDCFRKLAELACIDTESINWLSVVEGIVHRWAILQISEMTFKL